MTDLTSRITAALDEQQRLAEAATPGPWVAKLDYPQSVSSPAWLAATRPLVGWWFNIAAQAAWLAYALATRQWGFVVTAVAYAVVYVRLLRRARAASPEETQP